MLRHSVDAVLTGIGTVLADDPLLTDRSGRPRPRPLLRVVLDSQLRLPLESKLAQSAQDNLMIFCTEAPDERARQLVQAGAIVERIASGASRAHVYDILRLLGGLQVTHVLVEAGSHLNNAFLSEGQVDRLFLYYAPKFLGSEGVPMSQGWTIPELPVHSAALHRFGNDFACEVWFHDYWPNSEPSTAGAGKLAATSHNEPESASLAETWGAGTFDSVAASLTYHFEQHGAELGAASLLQYLRKADRFVANLDRSKRVRLPDGSIRYTKNNRYVIRSADGKILSFGLVTP